MMLIKKNTDLHDFDDVWKKMKHCAHDTYKQCFGNNFKQIENCNKSFEIWLDSEYTFWNLKHLVKHRTFCLTMRYFENIDLNVFDNVRLTKNKTLY